MKNEQLNQLLYEALETEMGGVQVYETAIRCAVNEDLKEEWEEYHEQTQKHEQIVRDLFGKLGLDPEKETPGRQIVRHIGKSLVKAMEMARPASRSGSDRGRGMRGQAETKDHLGLWRGREKARRRAKAKEALDKSRKEDDIFSRRAGPGLWIDSLGLPAAIPPPKKRRR
jgi:rubrerythrin